MDSINLNFNQQRSRGSDRDCATSQSSLSGEAIGGRRRRGKRGKRRGRKRRRLGRKRLLKSERMAKTSLRITYWNCSSLSVRRSTAEVLACDADIVCLQETQRGHMKPTDYHDLIKNDDGHGQLIAVRKGIKHKQLDVSRWASNNLHLVAVELEDQPVRNVVNVYACCGTMKEPDWMILDSLQNTLPGETLLCGDFNARGALWGNVVTNQQGEALEDALDKCYLTCLNNGEITRIASRQGDTDSIIDLTLTTLRLAGQCSFSTLENAHGSDHLPCVIYVRRSRVAKKQRRARAFRYSKEGDDPITKLRSRSTAVKSQKGQHKVQPPWFKDEVKELWKKKIEAGKRAQRNKGNTALKDAAKQASAEFEKAASKEKERLYEEFSRTVSEDRSLHKFWQLHRAMNCTKKAKDIPDFRREDGVWVRTPEEKGTALFDRFLNQTDQKNESERKELLGSLQQMYEDELLTPHTPIEADGLQRVIAEATESAPGPDGVSYSDLKTLGDQDHQSLTNMLNDSFATHEIPDEWLDSHLGPVPKPDKDHTSIKGYRIVTMQNTVGKLLEKVVSRRLAIQLEEQGLLPSTLGSYRKGKDTWTNAAVLASDVYDAFERKEETIVVALDLEDAYNRVDYRILMRTMVNMKINPFVILWIGAALLKRKVALRVGPWSSQVRTITPGLPQGSALSPVLFNIYTVGVTSNQLEAPGRTLSFADDVLVYRHGRNRQEMASSAQEELNRLDGWCDEFKGRIHPDKAGVLWCSLNNHSVKADMPAVYIEGKELKREQSLRYLGITFDRSLCGNEHISRVIVKARKGLVALKTVAVARMSQRILVILYQTLILSVIEYGFGLLTLSKTQLSRLEVIQNEAMRAILGCTRDTSAEAMRYLLDFPTMSERHRLAQVKAFLRVTTDVNHPLHNKVGNRPASRLKRGAEWMTEATKTIDSCLSVESIRRGSAWQYIDDYEEKFTHVVASLGRECREWNPGEADKAVEELIQENSSDEDAIIFTDGSVKRGVKSGWAFTVRIKGEVVAEGSGAVDITTSSMLMEVKAISEAMKYLQEHGIRKAVIVTDSMSTLQKVKKEYLYADWFKVLQESALERLTWVFSPGHSGVVGNERADRLAGTAAVDNNLTLDPPTVVQCVKQHLESIRPPSSSFTLSRLKEKGVQAGVGVCCTLRGATRRRMNQMQMETVSLPTLRWLLAVRCEQEWIYPDCEDHNAGHK